MTLDTREEERGMERNHKRIEKIEWRQGEKGEKRKEREKEKGRMKEKQLIMAAHYKFN